ncbi:MAG: BufA1 family periplasmic bufferin-type metallophore [Rhodospirillales bacterium]
MKTTSVMIASAVAAALSLASTMAVAQEKKAEKCYGIVKAGKNDCQTAASSCAGTSKKDAQADAWLYVPAGTCAKIVGASLEPKKG